MPIIPIINTIAQVAIATVAIVALISWKKVRKEDKYRREQDTIDSFVNSILELSLFLERNLQFVNEVETEIKASIKRTGGDIDTALNSYYRLQRPTVESEIENTIETLHKNIDKIERRIDFFYLKIRTFSPKYADRINVHYQKLIHNVYLPIHVLLLTLKTLGLKIHTEEEVFVPIDLFDPTISGPYEKIQKTIMRHRQKLEKLIKNR